MKTNIFLFALLGMVLSLSACKDDDEDNPTVEDSFTYNNQTYQVNSGAILEYGPIGLTDDEDTHFANAFLVSDGTMSFPQDADPSLTGATYVLITFLYSKNPSSFSGGTFEWVNPATATPDDVLGKDVMLFASLSIDSNNDGDVEDSGDLDYEVSAGNVVVEGSGTNYSVTYDLTFNGQRLQGNYEGPFTIIDGSDFVDSNGEGTFSYMDETYDASFGLIENFGGSDADEDGENDFYNYDFYITDGFYTIDDGDFYMDGDATIEVYAELLSASGSSFETGTFTFIPNYEITSLDESFFSSAHILIDLNGDGDTDDANEFAQATGGAITVAGDDGDYTLTFDLELDNGETLQGVFVADFEYLDNSSGERRGLMDNTKTRQRSKIGKGKPQLFKK